MLTKFLNWFKTTSLWVRLARHTIAHFTFRLFGYPKFPIEKYFDIVDAMTLDPDALYSFVSADKSSLAWRLNHFITGAFWGHAGIVLFEGGKPTAWHMKGNGLNGWHLLDILKECDNFALVKLPLHGADLTEAKRRLEVLKNAPLVAYDYQLELTPDVLDFLQLGAPIEEGAKPLKIYCSELNYAICYGLIKDPTWKGYWEPRVKVGMHVFEPDQVYAGGPVVFED